MQFSSLIEILQKTRSFQSCRSLGSITLSKARVHHHGSPQQPTKSKTAKTGSRFLRRESGISLFWAWVSKLDFHSRFSGPRIYEAHKMANGSGCCSTFAGEFRKSVLLYRMVPRHFWLISAENGIFSYQWISDHTILRLKSLSAPSS